MTNSYTELEEAPLGKSTIYVDHYSPEQLFPIPRALAREKTGIDPSALPFVGVDIWNGSELSWLNPKGKPEVALIEVRFPCLSPQIVESKSLKLYLNSFSLSHFEGRQEVEQIIAEDLTEAVKATVAVRVTPLSALKEIKIGRFAGQSLDELDITTDCYQVNPDFLGFDESSEEVDETLFSELLKSNCLATGQPDWGDIQIHYRGGQIDHAGLLKYIISYRNHSGFAEHCVEQIYGDILRRCQPRKLSVYARYTKRGGLDICPYRSNFESIPENSRHFRQ